MTPLRRLVLFAACAAAAGNNTTRATKETKPADQPLADNYGVNQTRAVNETKQAATDQIFVQDAATGVNQTNAVDGTTSTDGIYANMTPNMTMVKVENKSRKARHSTVVVSGGPDGADGPDGRGGLGGRRASTFENPLFDVGLEFHWSMLGNPSVKLGYLLRGMKMEEVEAANSPEYLKKLEEIRFALNMSGAA